jgi:non-structural maintenance of chromosomes element 1
MSSKNIPKLNDAQHYLLQVLMTRGVIDQSQFKDLFRAVLDKFQIEYDANDDQTFKIKYAEFMNNINKTIKRFNMEIRLGYCQQTGHTFYCIVRQCESSSIGQLSTLYTPNELKMFRKIMSMIFESANGCAGYNSILNEINDDFDVAAARASTQSQVIKKPTMIEIAACVRKLIKHNWLAEIYSQPNMITLHGRALIELDQYISELYIDEMLNNCFICKSIVLLAGYSCKNCPIKLHRHCARTLFKKQTDCPKCRFKVAKEQIAQLEQCIRVAREGKEGVQEVESRTSTQL